MFKDLCVKNVSSCHAFGDSLPKPNIQMRSHQYPFSSFVYIIVIASLAKISWVLKFNSQNTIAFNCQRESSLTFGLTLPKPCLMMNIWPWSFMMHLIKEQKLGCYHHWQMLPNKKVKYPILWITIRHGTFLLAIQKSFKGSSSISRGLFNSFNLVSDHEDLFNALRSPLWEA